MMFSLYPIPEVQFGKGSFEKLPDTIKNKTKRLAVITGASSFVTTSKWEWFLDITEKEGITTYHHKVASEPSPELVDQITTAIKTNEVDMVIGIGGGSVLDTAKAVAGMAKEEGSVEAFLEGVGDKTPSGKTLPLIAIPTTAGTGSETTANAVISRNGTNGFKKSLRHPSYVPDTCLVDPALTVGCPPNITATCGMDCFTQLVEGYLSTGSSTFTDSLAIEAIKLVISHLKRCYTHPDDITARSGMSYATMISGIVLANSGLGTIHGFAPALGASFEVPHGVVCGTLMAEANKISLKHLRKNDKNKDALVKYSLLGKIITNQENQSAAYYQDTFIDYLQELTSGLNLPRLRSYGVKEKDIQKIVAKSANKNNPATLNQEEMAEIIASRI